MIGHDVGVPQRWRPSRLRDRSGRPVPASSAKRRRSTLTATISPVVLWRGPIDSGERAGADQVQHLVVAVEEAGALAAQQALGLIVGQQLAAQQQLLKLLARDLAAADLPPNLLQLALVEQVQVEAR